MTNKTTKITHNHIKNFFEEHAAKSQDLLNATMLQQETSIAEQRNLVEQQLIRRLLSNFPAQRILDLGCGNGRLAELFSPILYRGIDFSEKLIAQAEKRQLNKNFHFYTSSVTMLDTIPEIITEKYDTIIISGLLIYLNDEDIHRLTEQLIHITAQDCQIYIREPVSLLPHTLSLINHFSQELQSYYNAIYRQEEELFRLLSPLFIQGFKCLESGNVYQDPKLNNRKETIQRFFLLKRKKA